MQIDNLTFSCRDESVSSQIIALNQCCMIWIGLSSDQPRMSDLSVSMMTPFAPHPISSSLIESGDGDTSSTGQSISRGLAKKYKVQCFVSYNLPSRFEENLLEIMQSIFVLIERVLSADKSRIDDTDQSTG